MDLLQKLLGQSLRDIVLCGVVDLDCVPADFVPLLSSVYLEVGEQLVEMSRNEHTVQMEIAFVDAVHLECKLEDTQRICRSSIGKYVLTDPLADNRIAWINAYGSPKQCIMAIELGLACGQILFFDPSFIDGINFGGTEQKAIWQENADEHKMTSFGTPGRRQAH